jgi:hypothetical protein
MEGFISRPGTCGGLQCLACGADTHEPEAHRQRCAAALLAELEQLRRVVKNYCDINDRQKDGDIDEAYDEMAREVTRLRENKTPRPSVKWSKLAALDKPIKFGVPEKKEFEV